MIRIIRVLARTVPLRAEISNALVNFAGMTGSVVALVAKKKGSADPVIGYGFGSIGRYAQTEMILERFAPRILKADPEGYCDDSGHPDPVRMQTILRRNEKPRIGGSSLCLFLPLPWPWAYGPYGQLLQKV